MESLQIDFSTIRDATDNFSDAFKLGKGGFGTVYKVGNPQGINNPLKLANLFFIFYLNFEVDFDCFIYVLLSHIFRVSYPMDER